MENPYIPELALITHIWQETPTVQTLTVALKKPRSFTDKPGQFIELSVLGKGEFPVSLSGGVDRRNGRFDITIRRVGRVTEPLTKLPVGTTIGIRGLSATVSRWIGLPAETSCWWPAASA